jgi:uncharacterized protein (TIGR03435 family)
MKLRLFSLLTILCWSAATLHGQDLTGMWQGTGTGAAQVRIVLKIARAADGRLEGQLILIDQGAQPQTMGAISMDGRTVKWKVDALSATYEGTFTPDGDAVNGTLTRNDSRVAFNFARATPQTAWAIPEPTPPPKPMDPAADPGIEVATVKPMPEGTSGRGIGVRGDTITVTNYHLLNAITFAYDLHEQQVSGGPAWKSTDRFQIVIKPDKPGQPNPRQLRRLIQKVLTERFQLKFHNEQRDMAVYVISQASGAHKMTASAPGQNLPTVRFARPGLLPARNATMDELAQNLQTTVMDRPVVNQTKLEGRFDFTLDWLPDETQFGGAKVPDNGKPNIYEAFREQLGLRLEAMRAPATVMVIDSVEKPSEN